MILDINSGPKGAKTILLVIQEIVSVEMTNNFPRASKKLADDTKVVDGATMGRGCALTAFL